MNKVYKKRNTCRLCNSDNVRLVVPLGKSPVSEKYLTKENISEDQVKVPLDLYFCNNCSHVQLLDIVNPKFLWSDFTFQTANNPSLVDHFYDVSKRIISFLSIEKKDLILDIGSNDGTLLSCFKESGYNNVLGIDPSKEISDIANKAGVTTINDFFNKETSVDIFNKYGKAKIITANNVYAHIDDLTEITASIKSILDSNGVFVFEVSYLLDVVQKILIGTVFHEHLSYHSVKAIKSFLEAQGMKLIHVERGPEQGGSIVGYAQHAETAIDPYSSVEELLNLEHEYKLDKPETIMSMYTRLESVKSEVVRIVSNFHNDGKVIAGFGAARAGTTLLSYFKIGDKIDFLVDDNESKHFKFSPGDKIEVLPVAELYNKKPDYVLILAWLYADKIIDTHKKFISNGGGFVRLFPDVDIVEQ